MRRDEIISRLKGLEPRLRAMGASSLHLFGSRSTGDERDDSDVDLFIDVEPTRCFSLLDLVAAQRFLSEELAMRADMTTRDALHPALSAAVVEDAIRIF